jgi:hypothetical protein
VRFLALWSDETQLEESRDTGDSRVDQGADKSMGRSHFRRHPGRLLDWMEQISWVINNNEEYYIKWSNLIWDCLSRRRERWCSQDFLATLYIVYVIQIISHKWRSGWPILRQFQSHAYYRSLNFIVWPYSRFESSRKIHYCWNHNFDCNRSLALRNLQSVQYWVGIQPLAKHNHYAPDKNVVFIRHRHSPIGNTWQISSASLQKPAIVNRPDFWNDSFHPKSSASAVWYYVVINFSLRYRKRKKS